MSTVALRSPRMNPETPHAPSCSEQVGAGRASAGGVGPSPCADAPSTTVTT